MNRSNYAAWLFALCFAYAGSAVAGPSFDFTFAIGPNTGSAHVDTVDQGGGVFWATSGSLTVTGGLDIGTYSLGAAGPAPELTPAGGFNVDNLLYPALNPALDTFGLFFTGNGLEINIYSDDGSTPNHYWFTSTPCDIRVSNCTSADYNVDDEDRQGSFSVSAAAVPEPATLALLGVGLAGLGFSRRKQ